MKDVLETARLFALSLLDHERISGEITIEKIWTVIHKLEALNIDKSQSFDKDQLFQLLIDDLSIRKGSISAISDDIIPWLYAEKVNIIPELWNRYKIYMRNTDASFPINELDDFTDNILDKCVNPKQDGAWDRRGMVVGHVQSGKTSNYVGLINKATDAGYKVIIIIAGTISSLRRQTQERVDEGYIGRSSSAFINNGENRIIGVGNLKVNTAIYSFTSSYYELGDEGDFSAPIAKRLNIPIGINPVILVIKKNKSILENLIDWFSKDPNTKIENGFPTLFGVPTLIIDDEADAASINTSKDINKITSINNLVRTLINLFEKKTFIGYTATPYANLFIPQEHNPKLKSIIKGKNYLIGEDLFPRDFIINIKAPANYIGASKIFGLDDPTSSKVYEPLSIYKEINDFDPPFFSKINATNKKNLPDYLPNSLEYAIKCFILVCAIRRLRGHSKKHNSMLIHVALYVKWIDRIALLVNDKLKIYQNYINGSDSAFLKELENIYSKDFINTTLNVKDNLDYTDYRIDVHSWKDIEIELKAAVLKIEVRSVHGIRSTSNLEYNNIKEIDYKLNKEKGISVIAVGGSRLSRGITLEGLSISYYLRTSKMYDTLMQMGRWFGYRPGYVDLCRIFTTDQIYQWFNHITLATEEMRNDFDILSATLKKPKDFKLKVRNHNGLLTITSLAKLHFSKNISISFSGTKPQTYQISKSKTILENNLREFEKLICSIGEIKEENILYSNDGKKINYLLFRDQDVQIICDFIDQYINDQPNIKNSTISTYIKNQKDNKKIKEWSICIVCNTDERVFIDTKGDSPKDQRKSNFDVNKYQLKFENRKILIGCKVRNQHLDTRNGKYYLISKNQVDDIKDRQVDLLINNLKETKNIIDQRAKEKKGIILIYPLDERGASNINNGFPIIAYSIQFPKIDDEEKVSYTATISDGNDDEPMESDDNYEN